LWQCLSIGRDEPATQTKDETMKTFELNGKIYKANCELVDCLKSVLRPNQKDNSAFLGLFELALKAGSIQEVA